MKRIISILLFLSAVLSVNANGGDDSRDVMAHEYEQYFASLSPEEQVLEFTTQFTDFYLQSGPSEYVIAVNHFEKISGLVAMPYLKREFQKIPFTYASGKEWTELETEAPMHILELIWGMKYWFPEDPTRLRPSEEDVIWFIEATRKKIRTYIDQYRRIDSTVMGAEHYAREFEKWDSGLFYLATCADEAKEVYDQYISDDPELVATVGIPHDCVFEGCDGLVLPPPDPSNFTGVGP